MDTFSLVVSSWSIFSECSMFLGTCWLTDFVKPSATLYFVPTFCNHTFWFVIASCNYLYFTLMCFILPHPWRSAFAFVADESVLRMMWVSSWDSPRISCTCLASASADAIPWYSASAELRLTPLCVRLIVAIVFPSYLSTIPVVLFLVFAQPPQSLSLVAIGSSFAG